MRDSYEIYRRREKYTSFCAREMSFNSAPVSGRFCECLWAHFLWTQRMSRLCLCTMLSITWG